MDVDRLIAGMERFSQIAQLRDLVYRASQSGRRECGNCQHWMKSSICPHEHNVNGYSRGPSCSAPACHMMLMKPSALKLQRQRIAEAVAFARQHDLPEPPQ